MTRQLPYVLAVLADRAQASCDPAEVYAVAQRILDWLPDESHGDVVRRRAALERELARHRVGRPRRAGPDKRRRQPEDE